MNGGVSGESALVLLLPFSIQMRFPLLNSVKSCIKVPLGYGLKATPIFLRKQEVGKAC
jgi:hypothetical protein